jgi:tRNA uridine 5-carboxymethylaminomethyl modification enzyme
VGAARGATFAAKSKALADATRLLEGLTLTPTEAARHGFEINKDGRRRTGIELLAYPDIDLARLKAVWAELGALDTKIGAQVEIDARYAAYVRRQDIDIAALRKDEKAAIPDHFDYTTLASLSSEVRQKLELHRPATLAQAARIEGMTPAALMLLLAGLKKQAGRKTA